MGFVTGTLWFFNFVIAVTWPTFFKAFKSYGAFSYYAGWCVVGWILIFLYAPSPTSAQTFGMPTNEVKASCPKLKAEPWRVLTKFSSRDRGNLRQKPSTEVNKP